MLRLHSNEHRHALCPPAAAASLNTLTNCLGKSSRAEWQKRIWEISNHFHGSRKFTLEFDAFNYN